METSLAFIVFVIVLALAFDFTNGFHDAANSIATIVSTRGLTPFQAVMWAAFFNFIAFLFFKLAVANTVGTGLIHPDIISPFVIFAALMSAITWNLVTWYIGFPSSSSHALIGGLAGAGLAKGGLHSLIYSGYMKVISAIIISPLLGLVVGFIFTIIVTRLTQHNSETTNHRWFKRIQLISSAFLSLTHGSNDAQKTMGVIGVLLYSSAWTADPAFIPLWVVISCHFVIALGTLTGGWRIVYTMGEKITKLNTLKGTCAETAAACVIYAATDFGIPVSTTQTVTGAIAGVGLSPSIWGVQWSTMNKIFLTWILTIPGTALIAAAIMLFH